METLYHIANKKDWEQAQTLGHYWPAGATQDGFLHASYEHQLAGVAERFFKGKTGFVLLEINAAKLTTEIKVEKAHDIDDSFPHLYEPLNLDAVVAVSPFPKE